MKEKQLKAKQNKLLLKAKNKNRICYCKGCEEHAINSHILQKNGILTGISTNSHIYLWKTDFLNPLITPFKKSGLNVTFRFKGFCKEHDKTIFQPIEDHDIDFDDYKSQLLFAYRTILNEKFKKEVLIDFYNSLKNDSTLNGNINTIQINQMIEQTKLSIADLEYHENIMVSDLESGTENFIFHVRDIPEKGICLASHFTFETTREMQEYKRKTGQDLKITTAVFISLFPLEGENVLIMGHLKSKHDKCGEFVEHYFSIDDDTLLLEISNLMLRRCETWACSEEFYKTKIENRESEIIQIMEDASTDIDENELIDFNIFD